MGQITEWLDPANTYDHKLHGEKNNFMFCREVVEQINKDPERIATIERNARNQIAVFSKKKIIT